MTSPFADAIASCTHMLLWLTLRWMGQRRIGLQRGVRVGQHGARSSYSTRIRSARACSAMLLRLGHDERHLVAHEADNGSIHPPGDGLPPWKVEIAPAQDWLVVDLHHIH